jgi:hypothetical protein
LGVSSHCWHNNCNRRKGKNRQDKHRSSDESNANSNASSVTKALLEKRREEKSIKEKKDSATSVACPQDVSKQIWDDWVALRKSKKAPITQTVLNGAIDESKILGWPLEKFLAEWCSRGSQGLKAAWIAPKQNFADIARVTVPMNNRPDPALEKIKEDAKRAAPIPLEVLAKMAALRAKA